MTCKKSTTLINVTVIKVAIMMTSPVVTYDVVNRPIPWNMHRNADIAES